MKFLIRFADAIHAKHSIYGHLESWPELLSQLSEHYIRSSEHGKMEIGRYVALERRRCGGFLADKAGHPRPCFSLSDPEFFIGLLEPERRIAALREMARAFDPLFGLDAAIIRFVHSREDTGYVMVENATLVPQVMPGAQLALHRRWIVFSRKI